MCTFKTVQDFLHDDSFLQWTIEGKNASYWNAFIEQNPDKIALIVAAQKAIRLLQKTELQLDDSGQRTWERIQASIEQPSQNIPQKKVRTTTKLLLQLSASFIVLAIVLLTIWSKQSVQHPLFSSTQYLNHTPNSNWIHYFNHGQEVLYITLPDSSRITLFSNSQVLYDTSEFRKEERGVHLIGKAQFDVKRDSTRPFLVYTGELITKVLGTSFTINAFKEENEFTVNVLSGSVSVIATKPTFFSKSSLEENGLILQSNQEAIFDRAASNFSKKIVQDPQPLAHSIATLGYFEEVAVPTLLQQLEDLYGITIRYNTEELASCIITTNLTNLSLFEALEVICSTIGTHYTVIDAQIVLSAGSCQTT